MTIYPLARYYFWPSWYILRYAKEYKIKRIRTAVGVLDKYNNGKVVYIDFAYVDWTIVWVQYKIKTVGYIWQG